MCLDQKQHTDMQRVSQRSFLVRPHFFLPTYFFVFSVFLFASLSLSFIILYFQTFSPLFHLSILLVHTYLIFI